MKLNISRRTKKLSIVTLPVILFSLLLLSSCEDFFLSEANKVKIPGSEPQLVVYSFISPQDTFIKVQVERSVPYIMDPRDVPSVNGEAHVYMAKKGEEFTKLTYNEQLKAFVISAVDFAVEAENEYILKVESFNGETVEAVCYVPGFEVDTVIFRDVVQTLDQWGSYKAVIQWEVHPKPSTQPRYFRSGAFVKSMIIFFGSNDTLTYPANPIWLERGTEYFSHTNEVAPVFMGNYYSYLNLDGDESNSPYGEQIDSLFSIVLQTDYHYYRFHQSVENYYYHDEDFPFAESVHIYSNVKGGLGVFGGYNKKVIIGPSTPPKD